MLPPEMSDKGAEKEIKVTLGLAGMGTLNLEKLRLNKTKKTRNYDKYGNYIR
jgi:hypothetical protein